MPTRVHAKPLHRAWIEQARLQSDEADRQATEARAAAEQAGVALFAADHFPGYELEREIHRGAQGAVYRAVQKSTSRQVALKLLHDHVFGPGAPGLERARFEREMRVLAALKHPNIVTIHDGGSHDGRFFLVMDYIAGQPLDVYVGSRPRSIRETVELFIAICDAVHAAHLRGIIHRDLKPANVRVDVAGRPFVLDFGLAKVLDTGESVTYPDPVGTDHSFRIPHSALRTQTGQFLGSLPWSAPEQADGSPARIDLRTDVYALGVMLYQMLTGKFPYPVVGPMKQVFESILHAAPAPPRALRRDIDDELETIVLKCLSKEQERRYQIAGELAADLRRYLAGEPIEAKRDSGWYMVRKGLRRHRIAVAVAGGFFLLLAGFGVVMAAARADAQHEADKSRKVLAFMQGMLAGVDPEDFSRGGLTVREVLDHAAGRAERELADQPEVAVAVHQTLGNHYRTLGLYFDADRHLKKAVELRRSLTTGDDPELAVALNDLAGNLQEKQDKVDAEAPTREALDIRRRLFGPDSLEVAESLHDLVYILVDLGRAREGEPLIRESLQIRRRRLGPEHTDVATSLGMLGACLSALGRLDEAESAMRQAVEMMRRLPGDNERELAARLTFLSIVLRERGKYVEEEAAVREAIDIRSRRLAEDHPALAWNLHCLANVRRKLGDLDDAEVTCRKALDMYVRKRGPNHEDAADCMQLLAQIHEDRGRLAEAELWWVQCLELRRTLYPAGHPEIRHAEQALARNRAGQHSAVP